MTIADLKGENDPKRTKCCDYCETYWEPSFFCEKCSGLQEDPWYDPWDPDFWPEVWDGGPAYVLMNVCMNCCTGHPTDTNRDEFACDAPYGEDEAWPYCEDQTTWRDLLRDGWEQHVSFLGHVVRYLSLPQGQPGKDQIRLELTHAWHVELPHYWRHRVFGFIPYKCHGCGRRWRECPDDEEHQLPFSH